MGRFGRAHLPAGARVFVAALLVLTAFALGCALCGPAQRAHADELSEVRAQLSAQVEELSQLTADIEATDAHMKVIDEEIQSALDGIDEAQARYAELQDGLSVMAVSLYKDREDFSIADILSSSTTLDELFYRLDTTERVLGRYAGLSAEAKRTRSELQEKYQQVSASKDEQQALLAEMRRKTEQLDESIAELKAREKSLSADEQAALAQAAAAAGLVASTFETGTVGDDGVGWQLGWASAYGGSSDASTPNPGITATGTLCNDWSVGVAVPLAAGPGQYYGMRVEISYGGQSIIAPVVDCGYMDNGARALDLQPGVFKAFGFYTCADWGVREISYRFI